MIFIPMPLPKKVLQTSYCTHLFSENVIQTLLGMGMGMNVTAQEGFSWPRPGEIVRTGEAPPRRRESPEHLDPGGSWNGGLRVACAHLAANGHAKISHAEILGIWLGLPSSEGSHCYWTRFSLESAPKLGTSTKRGHTLLACRGLKKPRSPQASEEFAERTPPLSTLVSCCLRA